MWQAFRTCHALYGRNVPGIGSRHAPEAIADFRYPCAPEARGAENGLDALHCTCRGTRSLWYALRQVQWPECGH